MTASARVTAKTLAASASPSHERRGLDVTTRGLVVIYRSEGHDVAALSGIDLQVRSGEVVGLLGPSGAGKSTLLTVFGGLLEPSAGRVLIGHHDIKGMGPSQLDEFRAGDVGLVLQGAGRNLLPYLTPRQNVAFAQRRARRIGRDVPEVREVLALLGIEAIADQELDTLTPGQLQLSAIAVGIACFPGLLLGDEPTSQLDHESRDRVLDALHDISSRLGSTVIVVTHDPEVAARLPRTVTIRDGRVGSEGRLGEEYAVVSADGSVPLSGAALDDFPPGALVRLRHDGTSWVLESPDEGTGGDGDVGDESSETGRG
ncbi:ABC transporter ATP-binding protein [Monashia sp. NPDC004114]